MDQPIRDFNILSNLMSIQKLINFLKSFPYLNTYQYLSLKVDKSRDKKSLSFLLLLNLNFKFIFITSNSQLYKFSYR